MVDIKWQAATSGTSITISDIASLNNGYFSALSSSIENTDGDLFGDFQLVTSQTATEGDPLGELYLIRSADAASTWEDYESGAAGHAPAESFVGTWESAKDSSPQKSIIRGVPLPPDDFKIGVKNNSGANYSSGAVTVFMYRYQSA